MLWFFDCMCRKWHPDRHAADKKKAEDKFKEIAHAYETLSEPEKRKIYDQVSGSIVTADSTAGHPAGSNQAGMTAGPSLAVC